MKKFEIDETSDKSARIQSRETLLAMEIDDVIEFPRTLPLSTGGKESMMKVIDTLQNRYGGWINTTERGKNIVTRVSKTRVLR